MLPTPSQTPRRMKQGRGRSSFHPMSSILSSLLLFFCLSGSAHAYKNYTVGDSLGWFDNTENSNVNYQKWADTKEFTLGDFLSNSLTHTVSSSFSACNMFSSSISQKWFMILYMCVCSDFDFNSFT